MLNRNVGERVRFKTENQFFYASIYKYPIIM